MTNSSENQPLYVITSPLYQARAKIIAAHAISDAREGKKPTVAVCYASHGACDSNVLGLKSTCQRCNRYVDQLESTLELPLVRIDPVDHKKAGALREDVRLLVEQSIRSTLMSATRMTQSLLPWSPGFRRRATRMRMTAFGLFHGVLQLIERQSATHVFFFNGRTVPSSAAKTAAVASNTDYTALEFSRDGAMQSYRKTSPHDRAFRQAKMFDEPHFADADEFEKLQTRDGNVFLQGDDCEESVGADTSYVVIFESSNDEVAALTDWERHVELLDCVQALIERTSHDVVIRWHPNQAGSGTNQVLVESRAALKFGPRVRVVTPWMQQNSYDLLQGASAAFTYGSTIGVEAAWAGVPTFLLGDAWYDKLSIAHIVSSADQIPDCLSWPQHPRALLEADCRRYMGHMRDWGYMLDCASAVVHKTNNEPGGRVDYILDVAPAFVGRPGAPPSERRFRIIRHAVDFLRTQWIGLPEGLKRSFPHGEVVQKPFVVQNQTIRYI